MVRRTRREKSWLPLPVRRALGPKRRYRKSFRRGLAIAIAVASAGAAISAWRGEDHARVAEEQERAAFDQTIALEQQRAEIRVSQLLDVISSYSRMKSAEFLSQELLSQADKSPTATDANQLRNESAVYRNLRYDILDTIPKDALTANYALTGATLNAGPSGIPDCPRARGAPAGNSNAGKFGLELQFRTTEADLCPVEELAASAHDFGHADDQIGVAALFILAAFLFTIAQISSRPRAVAFGVGGGALTFAASLVLFALIEAT